MAINLTVCGQTDVGLVRPSNEDAFVIADLTGGGRLQEGRLGRFELGPSGVLLAVSDGMGGHKAGDVASALVVESLRRSMSVPPPDAPANALLEEATRKANQDVWEAGRVPGRENMGATLTAVFVHDETAYIAEVGDSRAYLVRNGQIAQVTHDQTYVQLLVDAGAMTPEEATHSKFSSIILQAMGLQRDVQVALGRLELRQRDCFLLCSDGLWGTMTAEEIRNIVLTSPGLDTVCSRLVDLAKTRGGGDNITVIAAGVSGDLPAHVAGERISDTLFVLREFDPPPLS